MKICCQIFGYSLVYILNILFSFLFYDYFKEKSLQNPFSHSFSKLIVILFIYYTSKLKAIGFFHSFKYFETYKINK